MAIVRRVLAGLAIGLAVVGCGFGGGDHGPTAAPLPSGATALQLRTEAPSSPPGQPIGCALLNYDGHLSLQGSELVLGNGDVVWPRGFSARLLNGKAELVGPDGTVVAREGDHLEGQILGGYHEDGQFHVGCVKAAGLEWGPWGVRTLTPASPAASG